jgi:NitT/TauT family transport system permease protein
MLNRLDALAESVLARRLLPVALLAVIVGLWALLRLAVPSVDIVLPAPVDVVVALGKYRDPILSNAFWTLFTTMTGFGFAVVFGFIMGVAIGGSRFIYSSAYPLLVAFNAVPKVALVPIFVLWFGIGLVPAVLTAFSLSFFPIVVNVATGLATVQPEMEDVMRSLGATRLEILRKVGIPQAMPYFFASLKVAVTLAFVGSVISETVASNNGIGYLLLNASSHFQVGLVFAGLVVIAVMAVVAYLICNAIELRVTHWAFRGRPR